MCLVCTLAIAAEPPELVVEATLPGLVVLQIDRQRVTLRNGQSHGSVRLLEANSREAVLVVNGEEVRLGVSQRISGSFTVPEKRSLDVPRNDQLQYRSTAEINGESFSESSSLASHSASTKGFLALLLVQGRVLSLPK